LRHSSLSAAPQLPRKGMADGSSTGLGWAYCAMIRFGSHEPFGSRRGLRRFGGTDLRRYSKKTLGLEFPSGIHCLGN